AGRAMALRPHGAAHAAHGGGRALVVDGCARGPTSRWVASADPPRRARGQERAGRASRDALDPPSKPRRERVRHYLLVLARAGAVRRYAGVRPLAPRRACVLPRQRTAVLAAGDPPMAGAGDVAEVDDDSIPGARDVPEHAAGGHPDVLRPHHLPRIFLDR